MGRVMYSPSSDSVKAKSFQDCFNGYTINTPSVAFLVKCGLMDAVFCL